MATIEKKDNEAPQWLLNREGLNERQWKQRKRRELRAVLIAIQNYRMGCHFTPDRGEKVSAADKLLRELEKEQSVKQWGR